MLHPSYSDLMKVVNSEVEPGEDRLVKKSFKELKRAGIYAEVSEDVIRPSAQECRNNPRAKSTKLRWAIKA